MEPEMEPKWGPKRAPKLSLFWAPKQWKTLVFLVFSLKMAPRRGAKNRAKMEPEMGPELESKSGPKWAGNGEMLDFIWVGNLRKFSSKIFAKHFSVSKNEMSGIIWNTFSQSLRPNGAILREVSGGSKFYKISADISRCKIFRQKICRRNSKFENAM